MQVFEPKTYLTIQPVSRVVARMTNVAIRKSQLMSFHVGFYQFRGTVTDGAVVDGAVAEH